MRYPYGQGFSHAFNLEDPDGEILTPSADAPSVTLWLDQPSRADVINGTGTPLQTKSTWTDTDDGYVVDFDAVEDPDPANGEFVRKFWVAARFTLEVGGELLCTIQPVDIYRPGSESSPLSLTPSEVIDIYPRIAKFLTIPRIENYLAQARSEIKLEFEADGRRWGYLQEVNRYKLPLAYKTIELGAMNKSKREGDKYDLIAVKYAKRYAEKMAEVLALYDEDGDGEPDTEEADDDYVLVPR